MQGNLQIFVTFMCLAVAVACRGGTILQSGITAQEKAQILESHNRLRAIVAMGRVPGQPGAENMREMVWDDELAANAQRWANECTFKHDPDRTIARFTMGQNMAIIWSTDELAVNDGDFPSRIQNWFNEVQKYAFGASWSPKTGHYSQLVWGDTDLVGCGYSHYKTGTKYNKLYVCNYGPGGNVVGSSPYAVGQPSCSNHGMKPSSHYQGLCSAQGTGIQRNQIVSTYSFKTQSFNTKNVYAQQPQQTAYTSTYQKPQQPQQPDYGFKQYYNKYHQQQEYQKQKFISQFRQQTQQPKYTTANTFKWNTHFHRSYGRK